MNYKAKADSASRMLKKFGIQRTFTRKGEGVYDPITGKETGVSTTDFPVFCVVFDYTSKNAGNGTIEGTTIKTGDKRVIIEAQDYKPQSGDTTVIDGDIYTVKTFTSLSPTDIPVMHELQMRR